jgi:aminoglycoside 2''-phosphotransferase
MLPRLAPLLPAPVPQPAFVMRFSIHELVPGVQLAEEGWRQLPGATRAALGYAIGRFLEALHEIDPSVASSCQTRWFDHQAHAQQLRERVERTGEPALTRTEVLAALDRYLMKGAEWVYQPAILHADVSPEHVLIDPDQGEITGVIDWGDLRIGDPARDFIFLYEDWGFDFLVRALDAYERESRETMQPRVMMLYLMDQLDWALRAAEQGRRTDFADGLNALDRAMKDFRRGMSEGRA